MYIREVFQDLNDEHNRIRSFCERFCSGDVVVNFNYDILVEKALFGLKRWSLLKGYGFNLWDHFAKIPANVPDESLVQDLDLSDARLVPVLKPHGSVNWVGSLVASRGPQGRKWIGRCWIGAREGEFGNNKALLISPKEMGEPAVTAMASKGGPGMIPAERPPETMILPSFIKCYANTPPLLLEVWHKVHQRLAESDEIWIIGYSVSEADTDAQLLLSAARKCREFHIVDIEPKGVKSRLGRLVSRKASIDQHKCLFEDFAKKGCESG